MHGFARMYAITNMTKSGLVESKLGQEEARENSDRRRERARGFDAHPMLAKRLGPFDSLKFQEGSVPIRPQQK